MRAISEYLVALHRAETTWKGLSVEERTALLEKVRNEIPSKAFLPEQHVGISVTIAGLAKTDFVDLPAVLSAFFLMIHEENGAFVL